MSNKYSRNETPAQETQATATPPNRPTDKAPSGSSDGTLQVTRKTANAALTARTTQGETLAIQGAQAFSKAYLETNAKIAPALAAVMAESDQAFIEAITGAAPVPVAPGESLTDAFLLELKAGLS